MQVFDSPSLSYLASAVLPHLPSPLNLAICVEPLAPASTCFDAAQEDVLLHHASTPAIDSAHLLWPADYSYSFHTSSLLVTPMRPSALLSPAPPSGSASPAPSCLFDSRHHYANDDGEPFQLSPRPLTGSEENATQDEVRLSCHRCHALKPANVFWVCPSRLNTVNHNRVCNRKFCVVCRDVLHIDTGSTAPLNWRCPACTGTCDCAMCLRARTAVIATPQRVKRQRTASTSGKVTGCANRRAK